MKSLLVERYHVKLASQTDQISKVQDQISKVIKNGYSIRVLSGLSIPIVVFTGMIK